MMMIPSESSDPLEDCHEKLRGLSVVVLEAMGALEGRGDAPHCFNSVIGVSSSHAPLG